MRTKVVQRGKLETKHKLTKIKQKFDKKQQTSALDSKASRKKAADTKCFPTDSANLIWPSQYDDVSSLSIRHLLQFSTLWYNVSAILSLVSEADATGVLDVTTFTTIATFSIDFSSSWSENRTLFFFDLGFAFSGEFFNLVDLGCMLLSNPNCEFDYRLLGYVDYRYVLDVVANNTKHPPLLGNREVEIW